ncbi:hypothetical protein [Flavobacterium sp. JP2137]|uniref:hypothetical protein n=1 Tax=Flavobacterium sp. JP2137 TaxID=3414510 RepID=UPI003D2FB381
MNFKLLAIRPLEGCDPNLLKGLKTNCIYRFYNEYEFINCIDKNVNSQDYIKSRKSDNIEYFIGYENQVVSKIKYIKQVPDNFYSNNINVSAVVGENGSGKSSLLELIYYFLFDYSVYEEIIIEDEDNPKVHQKIFNIEFYCFYNGKIIKIIYSSNQNLNVSEFILKGQYFEIEETKELSDVVFFQNTFKYKNSILKSFLPFYNIVSNYGLYGLNSKLDGFGWVKHIIHKNDGYQTPIVINPFRTYGNIDINREYTLLHQRLIINHYVIKNKDLLVNISLDKVSYSINILKHQFYKYYINEDFISTIGDNVQVELSSKEIITETKKNILVREYNYIIVNRLKKILSLLFSDEGVRGFLESLINDISKSDILINYWNTKVENTENFILDKSNPNLNREEIEYLNLLYIFKKLEKITKVYEEYERFNYIFSEVNQDEIFSLKEKNIDELNKLCSKNNDEDNSEELFLIVDKAFTSFEELLIPKKKDANLNSRIDFIQRIINENKDNQGKLNCESLLNSIVSMLNNEKKLDFILYIKRLKENKTHIGFKVKQAISYFENDTLKNLFVENVGELNPKTGFYDFKVNDNYFKKSDGNDESFKIDNVPLAFFELDILVKKDGQKSTYPFSYLSSGEQQMINSLLTISYHLFNLESNHGTPYNKLEYKNINIIMDEIELYFHPNYQKNYVRELLRTLSFFNEFSFNVIFSTHSPFILSDIPSQNVLKLQDGLPVDREQINSFGANIHDLLADEFFLKNGAIGEFANFKINELVNFMYLQNKISNLNQELKNSEDEVQENFKKLLEYYKKQLLKLRKYKTKEIEEVIQLIGEPLIRTKMGEMFNRIKKLI